MKKIPAAGARRGASGLGRASDREARGAGTRTGAALAMGAGKPLDHFDMDDSDPDDASTELGAIKRGTSNDYDEDSFDVDDEDSKAAARPDDDVKKGESVDDSLLRMLADDDGNGDVNKGDDSSDLDLGVFGAGVRASGTRRGATANTGMGRRGKAATQGSNDQNNRDSVFSLDTNKAERETQANAAKNSQREKVTDASRTNAAETRVGSKKQTLSLDDSNDILGLLGGDSPTAPERGAVADDSVEFDMGGYQPSSFAGRPRAGSRSSADAGRRIGISSSVGVVPKTLGIGVTQPDDSDDLNLAPTASKPQIHPAAELPDMGAASETLPRRDPSTGQDLNEKNHVAVGDVGVTQRSASRISTPRSVTDHTPRMLMNATDIAHCHAQEKEALKSAHVREMTALSKAHDAEVHSLREELLQLRLKAMDTLTSAEMGDAAKEAAQASADASDARREVSRLTAELDSARAKIADAEARANAAEARTLDISAQMQEALLARDSTEAELRRVTMAAEASRAASVAASDLVAAEQRHAADIAAARALVEEERRVMLKHANSAELIGEMVAKVESATRLNMELQDKAGSVSYSATFLDYIQSIFRYLNFFCHLDPFSRRSMSATAHLQTERHDSSCLRLL